MGKYLGFEDTTIWKEAHSAVLAIYEMSKKFPSEERFALLSQMRRAAVSIEANIAEAFGRYHYKDKLNFYYNSRGSIEETKSHMMTSRDLGYITRDDFNAVKVQLDIVKVEINRIITTLRNKDN
jgi:four helix bundle protein